MKKIKIFYTKAGYGYLDLEKDFNDFIEKLDIIYDIQMSETNNGLTILLIYG